MKQWLTILLCVIALGAGALVGMQLAGPDSADDKVPDASAASAALETSADVRAVSSAEATLDENTVPEQMAEPVAITVYKSPTCGCCGDWIKHLQEQGFAVTAHNRDDMNRIKAEAGLPPRLASCHTAFVGDYVVEGHVPGADIKRLLAEQPAAAGLAVPGMPIGSPGMEMGGRSDAYDVLLFQQDGSARVFQHYPAGG